MATMWRNSLFLIAALVVGCAHSGVAKINDDTFMIANSEWGFSSGAYQKAKAMQEADAFCQSNGKQVILLESASNDVEFGKVPAAQVVFRCR